MSVEDVISEMKLTYADCDQSKSFAETESVRRLDWVSGERIPLEDAHKAYDCIPGYNEFSPEIIRAMQNEFSGLGFEVTCAREGSVCLYLRLNQNGDKAKVKHYCEHNLNADEVDWDDDDTLRIWWD